MEQRLQAYEGITVPRFPNFFLMLGPYSFIGTSFFATMEAHTRHLIRCLETARRRDATRVEVTQRAHDDYYFADIQRRQANTLFFNSDCSSANSYYFDAHGDAPLLRPSSSLELHLRSRFFKLSHYDFS